MVLGEDAGVELVERTGAVEAVMVVAVPEAQTGFRLVLSSGAADRFEVTAKP